MNRPETYSCPVWIHEDGREWYYEEIWEQCEFSLEESLARGDDPPELECHEYVSYSCGSKLYCAEHFKELVEPHCRVEWR